MDLEKDSVVRYCKPSQCDNGKPLAAAFLLRKKDPVYNRPEDEKELSVDHFEFFKSDNYKNIINALKNRNLIVKPNGCLAKVPYSTLKSDIKKSINIDISIELTDYSHSLIKNLYKSDEEASYIFLRNITEYMKVSEI